MIEALSWREAELDHHSTPISRIDLNIGHHHDACNNTTVVYNNWYTPCQYSESNTKL